MPPMPPVETQLIPAQPGWFIVWADTETREPVLEPIVAWIVALCRRTDGSHASSGVYPVGLEGTPDDRPEAEPYAVLAPSGDWSILSDRFGDGGAGKAVAALLDVLNARKRGIQPVTIPDRDPAFESAYRRGYEHGAWAAVQAHDRGEPDERIQQWLHEIKTWRIKGGEQMTHPPSV